MLNLPERDSDIDIMMENEFPYMSGRLKEIDYMKIIKEGKPWSDPTFPPGKHALFSNHLTPQKEHRDSKKRWENHFKFKRASEYFGKNNFLIFDGVDPSDTIMGSCSNCYAFAALSGIAEATEEEM